MLALNTALCDAVLVGKVPLKFCWYTHPIIRSNLYRRTSFLVNTVFNSEHLDPQIVDFDSNVFDVLFDNCANRTVSPVKSDFYYLEEYDGNLTGIGTAPIKGVGTLHWQIKSDEGCIIDVIVENALYCPNMQYRILSVTQWGKQRTSSCKDNLPDLTRIVTKPDENYTILYANWWKDVCTITHTNDLPKGRCTCPNNITFTAFVHKFKSYNNVCQLVQGSPNRVSKPETYAMSCKSMQPEPQLQYCDTSPLVSDEEQPQVQPLQPILKEPKYSRSVSFDKSPTESTQEQTEDDSSTPNEKDTTKTPTEKAQPNLLKCHLQYGLMSFGILVQAAQQGILPKNIITKEYPKCPSCLYGKST